MKRWRLVKIDSCQARSVALLHMPMTASPLRSRRPVQSERKGLQQVVQGG